MQRKLRECLLQKLRHCFCVCRMKQNHIRSYNVPSVSQSAFPSQLPCSQGISRISCSLQTLLFFLLINVCTICSLCFEIPLPSLHPVNSYLSLKTQFKCLSPRKSQTHPQPGLIFVYALYLPCSLSRAGCYCIALSLLDDTFFFIHYWVGFVLKYCLFNVFIAHLLGTGPYTQFKKLCLSIKSENLGDALCKNKSQIEIVKKVS